MMTRDNQSPLGTAFTVSIDARHGVTTGISARDRAHTILRRDRRRRAPGERRHAGSHLSAAGARAACWCAPGTPKARSISRAWPGRQAGRRDLRDHARGRRDGAPAGSRAFAAEHGLGIVRIADLIQYRLRASCWCAALSESDRAAARRRLDGRVPRLRLRAPTSRTRSTWRWCWATSPDRPTLVRVQTAHVARDVFAHRRDGLDPATWLR